MWNDGIKHHDIGNRSKHQTKAFAFALSCFQIRVPSTWVVTGPTFPTRDLFVTEVPLSMHNLGTDDE